MPGDDLHEIALAVGKLRRHAKLPDQHDLLARKIDRQHGDRGSGAQEVARFHVLARPAHAHALVGTKSAGEDLARLNQHVGGRIGDRIGV